MTTDSLHFALLGDDAAAAPLLEALAQQGHRLLRAALADHLLSRMPAFADVPRSGWEELLVDAAVEAVIVAGDSDDVQFAAKQLAAAGKPLLIVPKAALGAACAYELSLIRDDSLIVLMPVFVHRADSEWTALAQRLATHDAGVVRRLQIEVELPPRAGTNSASSLTDGELDEAALADIDFLRWLGGNYDQVTALRSGQTDQGCSQATLTLASDGLPDATWTARRGSTRTWKLTVETERETYVAKRDGSEVEQLTTSASSLISGFTTVVRRAVPSLPAARCPLPAALPDWPDAVRVFDVLDAARRSLRRRRTIDLHFESLSERSQFKTQMTAVGCGLLLLTLVLMLGLLGLGSLLESRDRAVNDAASLGLLLSSQDFEPHTAQLSGGGEARLLTISRRLADEPKSLYLEPADQPPDHELDQRRRTLVAERLRDLGIAAADHRTLLAPPQSAGWEFLLRVLRLAWIAPLVLFLALQVLLLVAKPAAAR